MRPRVGPEDPPPYVLDVEASGFGPASYPIEVGVALERGRRHNRLIRPAPGWTHWDAAAERVHRVDRATLERHGRGARDVAAELNALLAGRTVYSDAWVVDRPWLTRLYHAGGLDMRFTLSPLEALLSDARLARWDAVKREVTRELAVPRHRASHDAWIVQETLGRVLAEAL